MVRLHGPQCKPTLSLVCDMAFMLDERNVHLHAIIPSLRPNSRSGQKRRKMGTLLFKLGPALSFLFFLASWGSEWSTFMYTELLGWPG